MMDALFVCIPKMPFSPYGENRPARGLVSAMWCRCLSYTDRDEPV